MIITPAFMHRTYDVGVALVEKTIWQQNPHRFRYQSVSMNTNLDRYISCGSAYPLSKMVFA